MEEERKFVVFARIDDEDKKVIIDSVLLTDEQLNAVHWLYSQGFLKGTFETNDRICIDEP